MLRWCARASLAILLLAGPELAYSREWSARPVVAMIEALQRSGVEVLYSSELVPADLRVRAEPVGTNLLEQTAAALAGADLRLLEIAPGRYAVVRGPGAPSDRPSSGARAGEPLVRQPPAAALEEVNIYASHFALDARAVDRAVVLDRNQIEQVPGARNDALRATHSLPGFAADASARPFVRGSLQDDVLMVFDHVPIADPFHLKSFQSLTSVFDSSVIDRMELYSGGYPVRYGTRSGGVIDLSPHRVEQGHEEQVTLGLQAMQIASAGHASAAPLDWLLSARRSVLNSLVEAGDSTFSQPVFVDVVGRLHWQASERWSWTLGTLLLDDRVALQVEPRAEQASAQYTDSYFWLSLENQPSARCSSRTTLNVARAERARSGSVAWPNVIAGAVEEERDFSSVTLSTEWNVQANERNRWNFGLELGRTSGDNAYHRLLSFDPAVLGALGADLSHETRAELAPRLDRYAAFTSLRRQIGARVSAEFGMRLDGERYWPGFQAEQWSPRLNLRVHAAERVDLYASWGKFTQAQRPDEWRLEEAQVNPDPVQQAWHYIAGVAFRPSASVQWRAELYSKRWNRVSPYFDNLLRSQTLLPDLAPDRVRIAPRSAEADGAELSVRGVAGPNLQYWANYTWARVSDELARADIVRSWDQTSALSAGLSLAHGRYRAAGVVRYHSGWPRTAAHPLPRLSASDPLFTLGSRNADRWSPFLSLDLRGSWIRPYRSSELELWMELNNLANRGNDCCVEFAVQSPASAALTDDAHWQPRMLNLGMSWRFH